MNAAFGPLLAIIIASPAVGWAGENWREIAPQCATIVSRSVGCVSCSGEWADIARCTIINSGLDQHDMERCISRVRLRHTKPGDDRLVMVMQCLGVP